MLLRNCVSYGAPAAVLLQRLCNINGCDSTRYKGQAQVAGRNCQSLRFDLVPLQVDVSE